MEMLEADTDCDVIKYLPVPLVVATEENFEPFGRFVSDYEKEEVWIEEWPCKGWRKLMEGTGRGGGVMGGEYRCYWENNQLRFMDVLNPDEEILEIGTLPEGESNTDRRHILIREASYHPDGGQVFHPRHRTPFIAFLARPGDDIRMKDFVAFYFDGSHGIQIKANIWHQAACVSSDEAFFLGKQGKVHGIITMDSVQEFGKYFLVPLKLDAK